MHLYLSPHHDDICFSLAHVASRFSGTLINLFTRSHYVEAALDLPLEDVARIETVTRLRRDEDLRFAEAARLVRHDLELPEPALAGLTPFDRTGIEIEIAFLSARLVPHLLTLLPEAAPEPASLFCPMAIGGHRNHLSTLLAVRAAFDRLHQRCTLYLYEDLPYASAPGAREAGLRHAAQLFAGCRLSGRTFLLDADHAARKMELIGLYPSQFSRNPRETDFRPASGVTPAMHEIIWRVVPQHGSPA